VIHKISALLIHFLWSVILEIWISWKSKSKFIPEKYLEMFSENHKLLILFLARTAIVYGCQIRRHKNNFISMISRDQLKIRLF